MCSNYLQNVSEVREYMQSRDKYFSHTIEPKLRVTNQGMSGRCWMFAVLNVIRHELIRDLHLPYDFELSESYLSFYEKLEKCNYFLTQFMELEEINVTENGHIRETLMSGLTEGGLWQSCGNLISKYGLVPQSCFLESVNSFDTHSINSLINSKLRQFAKELVSTPFNQRDKVKSKMMEEIYGILSKMLGTPPNPNEEFEWSFVPKLDMTELLEIDQNRRDTGEFKTLEIKKNIKITPLDFYNKFVAKKMEDYLSFSNDPRNTYGKYYESFNNDAVIGAHKAGYFNIEMEYLEKMCIVSILNNTPVMFCCDIDHYMNTNQELFDTKCFNYDMVFGTAFDNLTKKETLELCESYANHAMVLVGVDLDPITNQPIKWKVENSWGRIRHTLNPDDDSGYFTMSHEWFKRYVYNVLIYKDFLHRKEIVVYNNAKKNKITLPENDVMA